MANTKQMYLDLLKTCLCGTHFDESSWKLKNGRTAEYVNGRLRRTF